MKNAVIFFLLGMIAGAVALHLYQQREAAPVASMTAATDPQAGEAKDSAVGARDSLDRKLREWKLTPEDIKQDLVQTGKVIRAKTTAVGERIDDARIIAVVKAKYVLDSDLSALAISVDCRDGDITLSGVVKSPALIGRAIALALETRGVRNVTSSLTVQS